MTGNRRQIIVALYFSILTVWVDYDYDTMDLWMAMIPVRLICAGGGVFCGLSLHYDSTIMLL